VSQSAIWDALLIAGDALQDGRHDDYEGVLAELDAMEAWSFECWPTQRHTSAMSLSSLDQILQAYFTPDAITQLSMRDNPSFSMLGINVVADPNAPTNRAYLVSRDKYYGSVSFEHADLGDQQQRAARAVELAGGQPRTAYVDPHTYQALVEEGKRRLRGERAQRRSTLRSSLFAALDRARAVGGHA
jgi:hypothetical protein